MPFAPPCKMRYHWGLIMEEPSVFDYVKSRIFFWRGDVIEIPPAEVDKAEAGAPSAPEFVEPLPEPAPDTPSIRSDVDFSRWLGWRVLLPLALALAAQRALEPPNRSLGFGVALYLMAAAAWIVLLVRGDLKLPQAPEPPLSDDGYRVRSGPLWAGLSGLCWPFWPSGATALTASI